MRTAALLLLLASASSHAMVLKCRAPNSNTFVTTAAQFCPSGTVFEKMVDGNDPQTAAYAESQPQYTTARPDCNSLRSIKNHYETLLKNNSSEFDLLSKFRNASNEMTKYGCGL